MGASPVTATTQSPEQSDCVSVVIPTRDRQSLLARMVETALHQRGVDIRVIIVDDASQDGTHSWLRRLGDPRVSFVKHSEPVGVAAARNVGIDRVCTPWVAFADDDDLWAPSKVMRQLRALRATPGARWVCTAAAVVDDCLRLERFQIPPTTEDVLSILLARNCIPGGASSVLAETTLIQEEGGFDPSLRILADWDLWIRLARRSPMASVSEPLTAYVRHSGSMSRGLGTIGHELNHVREKHAEVVAREQTPLDWSAWLPWMASLEWRSGRYTCALTRWGQLARQQGGLRSVIRSMAHELLPRQFLARHAKRRARGAAMGSDDLDEWLEPYRAL